MRPRSRTARVFAAVSLTALLVAVSFAAGCGSKTTPATKPGSPAAGRDSVAASTTATPQTTPAASPAPAEVVDFAKKSSWPVWYPTAVPAGMKIDTLDVLELEPGAGLVCDMFFVSGSSEIGFLQGSPTTREYEIVSIGKVPWGTETADVVHDDPEDASSPTSIVFHAKGTLAELSGTVSFEQLQSIAASMVLVK